MRRMSIPKAPGYGIVFTFGAAWNALVERSLWATVLCGGVALIIFGVKKWRKGRGNETMETMNPTYDVG